MMSTKKKIGILTFHRAYNFGSALQAYALNHYLNSCGFDAKTIDFVPSRQKSIYSTPKISFSLHSLALWLMYKINKKNTLVRYDKFNHFVKNNIALTSNYFDEYSDLSSLNNEFDAFVVGSDQIWNPRCDDFNDAYLLPFVREEICKIAYSPSIGAAELPTKYNQLFSKNISRFNFISLREKKSCDFIKELTNKDAVMAPDPVFLLNQTEWKKIKNNSVQKFAYILCYFIGSVDGMRPFCRKLAKENKCKIIVINPNLHEYFYFNKKKFNCGPEEFLNLIDNAKLICTDSFHAVAFSLIFNKDFYAFKKDNNGSPDERLINLLKYFSLENRIVNSDYFIPSKNIIRYETINKRISDFRQVGVNFLKEALM